MHPARSLVIVPLSTVSTHTRSRVWENLKINKDIISRCILGYQSEDVRKYGPLYKVIVAVEFATVFQASGPSKDAGNGVGAGWPPLKGETRITEASLHP